jgi:hypothetical protein
MTNPTKQNERKDVYSITWKQGLEVEREWARKMKKLGIKELRVY